MSPILVRPVREQLEHDRVIRLLQTRFRRRFDVGINPGAERNSPVGTGLAAVYPDVVLVSQDRGRKVMAVIEVETVESVNNLEAMAEWIPFGRLKSPFHLYVPAAMVDVARRLCSDSNIPVAEIHTYHWIGDEMRFLPIYKAPAPPEQAGQSAGQDKTQSGEEEIGGETTQEKRTVTQTQIALPFLRFTRDKRGYETTSLVYAGRRDGRSRQRILYWFRTPPGVKVGRPALDEEAIRWIEEHNPDIEFDWPKILEAQPAAAAPADDARTRRPRRDRNRPRPPRSAATQSGGAPQGDRPKPPSAELGLRELELPELELRNWNSQNRNRRNRNSRNLRNRNSGTGTCGTGTSGTGTPRTGTLEPEPWNPSNPKSLRPSSSSRTRKSRRRLPRRPCLSSKTWDASSSRACARDMRSFWHALPSAVEIMSASTRCARKPNP